MTIVIAILLTMIYVLGCVSWYYIGRTKGRNEVYKEKEME